MNIDFFDADRSASIGVNRRFRPAGPRLFTPGRRWRRALLLPTLLAATGGCFLIRPRPPDVPPNPERDRLVAALRADLQQRVRAVPGAAGLYFKDLDANEPIAIGADRVFHAASVMKLFVLVEAYKQAYAGTVSLDEPVEIADTFAGAADGAPFAVEDCAALRARLGTGPPTLQALCGEMIAVSSNCATNNVMRRLGDPAAITQTAQALGAVHTKVPRYIMDLAAHAKGIDPVTTPGDVGCILEQLARRAVVTPESSEAMLRVLTTAEGGFLGRELPASDVEIAHKTGAIDGVRHDAGILTSANGTWILVVLMQDLKDEAAGETAGAAISKACFEYIKQRPK